MTQALRVEDLHVHYGTIHAIQGVTFSVDQGEVVSIVGSNGAGKSTIMWSLTGVAERSSGTVEIFGEPLPAKPHDIVNRGVALVPERRRLFSALTVQENLIMGGYRRARDERMEADLERCFQLFPILKQRLKQRAGTLSGGEQQMLALARAMMSDPELIMMDEPSLGLAPLLVEEVFEIIREINKEGKTILLVEQNAFGALNVADYAYVLEVGAITLEGKGKDLLKDRRVIDAYLGG